MPTKKTEKSDKPAKPAAISRHKTATAKKTSEGQTFDIVPPSRVVPSATSRPVITANRPQQADNTLVSDMLPVGGPGSAPMVHKKLTLDITPSAAAEGPVAEPASDSDVKGAPEMPSKPGPTVAELLSAKQAALTAQPEPDAAVDPASDVEAVAEPKPEESDAKDEKDEKDEKVEKAQEEPAEQEEAVTDKSPADAPVASADPAEQAGPSASAAPEEPAKPAEEDDTLAGVLTTEAPQEPSEHTPEFKQALGDLKTSDEGKHPQEAKLYGGKSVIVVHEAHPVQTTLKWIFWFIFSLGLALLAFNLLLDAGVVSVGADLPHTDIINP